MADLYHFTNWAGIEGILTSKRIWARRWGTSNDRDEVSIALNVFAAELESIVRKYDRIFAQSEVGFAPDIGGRPPGVYFAEQVLDRINSLRGEEEVFTCSFTKKDDAPHFWLGYCSPPSQGYRLTIDEQRMLNCIHAGLQGGTLVLDTGPANYISPAEAKDRIRSTDTWAHLIGQVYSYAMCRPIAFDCGPKTVMFWHGISLANQILRSCSMYKSKYWEDDREWRLVVSYSESSHQEPTWDFHQMGQDRLKLPLFMRDELSMVMEDNGLNYNDALPRVRTCVKEVMISPYVDNPDESRRKLELLRERMNGDFEIKLSDAPIIIVKPNRRYQFDLIVEHDMTEGADVDRLFELFGGDVTPAVTRGTPLLMCSIEAESLESAVRDTLRRLQEAGIEVRTVQMEPGSLAA